MRDRDGVIEFHGVSKWYRVGTRRHYVLREVDCVFPRGASVGILGRNGAGKSTMVRMLGGTEAPNRGRIVRRARISWPLGLSGGFQGRLSGRDNVRFVCRIFDEDFARVIAFVEDFSELGDFLEAPVGTYSSGMRARLGFALSIAIDFDVYLIDEVTEVGDADFKKKCKAAFAERRDHANVIMVSHSSKTIRDYCQHAAIVGGGEFHWYDDVEAAITAYQAA